MVAVERRAVPRLTRPSTITQKLQATPQTYVVSALAIRWDRDAGRFFALVLLACALVCCNRC
jgi:hypothetical protein